MELNLNKCDEEQILQSIIKREKKDFCIVYELLYDDMVKKKRLKLIQSNA
jgi:hypothetical protein